MAEERGEKSAAELLREGQDLAGTILVPVCADWGLGEGFVDAVVMTVDRRPTQTAACRFPPKVRGHQ
jgi:hypothetical protein